MSEELMSVCDLLLLKSNTCYMHCPHKDLLNIHKSVFYSAHNPPSDPSQNCFLTRLLTK